MENNSGQGQKRFPGLGGLANTGWVGSSLLGGDPGESLVSWVQEVRKPQFQEYLYFSAKHNNHNDS